ncbi:MAG: hypothetical protein M1840_004772 [Geoglossum simile]|nr:MAG: hypothetical protein M1840_004772 [Geoglossum simile]
MATWRNRGYVLDSDDEGEDEGRGENEDKNGLAEASSALGSGGEEEKARAGDNDWYDIDELSNEYDGLSRRGLNLLGLNLRADKPLGHGMITETGADVDGAEVVDLVDVVEDGDSASPVAMEMLPETSGVVGDGIEAPPAACVQAEPERVCTPKKQLGQRACLITSASAANIHQPIETAFGASSIHMDCSSPLSDILSSPPTTLSTPIDSPQRSPCRTEGDLPPFRVVILQHDNRHHAADTWAAPNDRVDIGPPRELGRALRSRKPIQVHPYLLEQERYKQSLKARGVKPVRVVEVQSPVTKTPKAGDSQDREFLADDSQSNSNGAGRNSEDLGSSQLQEGDSLHVLAKCDTQSPVGEDSVLQVANDDDEFPDVNVLLRRPLNGAVQQGHKRRKTKQTTCKRLPPQPSTSIISGEADAPSARKPLSRVQSLLATHQVGSPVDQTIFDFPTSPPPSTMLRPIRPNSLPTSGFRFPKGFSPLDGEGNRVAVPPKRRMILESSEESDPEQSPPRRIFPFQIRPRSPSPTPSSSEEAAVQIRNAQRKIRGVLPASWLRFDQQNKSPRASEPHAKGDRQSHHRPAAKPIDRPGVARRKPISRSHSMSTLPDDVIEISDDSDDSSGRDLSHENLGFPQTQSDFRDRVGLRMIPPDLGEAEEDNRVDTMGPSTRGPARHKSKPSKKRQRRLDEPSSTLCSRPPVLAVPQKSALGYTYRKKLTTEERRVHRRPLVPKLSILDAPKTGVGTKGPIPPFLRIANRQARSRRDKARHSPSGKVIKLHTWRDTQDAQSVLRDWREGTILPVDQDTSSSISHSSHYARRSNAGLEKQQTRLPPLLNSTNGNRERGKVVVGPRPKFLKPAVRQMRLNPVVYRPPASGELAGGPNRKPLQPRTLAQVNADPRPILAPSGKYRSGPRPAQLEILEAELSNRSRRAAFASDLSFLDRLYRKQVMAPSRGPNLQLARFLADVDGHPSVRTSFEDNNRAQIGNRCREQEPISDNALAKAIRKPHKRPPKRLDLGSIENIPLDGPILARGSRSYAPSVRENEGKIVLEGLGPYGTCYTSNFGITPLRVGTYFHESTFIGSGDLSKALQTATSRNYDINIGYATFTSVERSLRWGSWDDTVSSELGSEFDWLALSIERLCIQDLSATDGNGRALGSILEIRQLIKFVMFYFKDFLSFADPIDRNSFVRRSTNILGALLERFALIFNPQIRPMSEQSVKVIAQTSTPLLILAYQILQITKKGILETSTSAGVEGLLKSTARWLVRLLLHQDLKQIRSFYEDNQRVSRRDEGIWEDDYLVEGWVVAIQILRQPDGQSDLFWDLLNEQLGQDKISHTATVQFFEQSWYGVISMLPLFEFDEFGILEVGRRFRCLDDNWKLVKALTSRLLSIYMSSPRKQPVAFNSYCRAVFSRCHHLIKGWGWRKCETIIWTLFDFFTSNNLAHLNGEESTGSPRFLQELDQEQSLEIEPGDRCFHILLKIIGVGLRAMRQFYSERRIRNTIFRLMPNHGRQYPKEEAVHREDLESLRNHHNLLCTLYWASPPSSRPPVGKIRDLVNPETSHREACHISLRAWSNLIRFQLSTKEPASSLEPFTEWHNELTSQMLKQHSLARTEAQAQFAASTNTSSITPMSSELLETTISRNQQQVEAVLSDALLSMKSAITTAKGTDLAITLLTRHSTADVFHLFDAKKHRLNTVVSQATAIVQEYVKISSHRNKCQSAPPSNEDSQDYGDWSALEDMVSQELGNGAAEHLCKTVYDSLLRLVSNCFGADIVPEDPFLLTITDTWVSVAQFLVKEGLKQWSNFIESYNRESWLSLRSTEQTRKFTTYFMSKVIESDATSYKANKPFFLSFWMSSLVERESLLKFQHRFTNVLLNHDRDNPILMNLPFWANGGSDEYSITASEFRARRLSLISSVLTNMRESVEESALTNTKQDTALRLGYVQLLKSLMGSMKSNYEEIRQGTTCSGAYVEFVQKVVEFLQQHTIDICPVDRFFTDSSAFPLPATDPTYVVGRLKNYGLRLSESGVYKQLASFLHSVSERAAAEQQQSYLTDQLYAAMSDTFESGDTTKPTLRAFLTQSIFPAYIEAALDTPTGWILARPVLRASEAMLDSLLTDIDSGNSACVGSVIAILSHILDSFRCSVDLLIANPGLLDQPPVLNTLTLYYSTITSMLHPLDYLQRRSRREARAAECVAFFTAFTTFIMHVIRGHHDEAISPYTTCSDFPTLPIPFPEARSFCAQGLRAMLKTNWSRQGDEYFVIRGKATVEVVVEIGTLEEEKDKLLEGMGYYLGVVERMRSLHSKGRVKRMGKWREAIEGLIL